MYLSLSNLSSIEAFCVFSTQNSPLLEYTVNYALKSGFLDVVVILDEKDFSDRDKRIWLERTGGHFEDYTKNEKREWNDKVRTYTVSSHNSSECINIIKKLELKCAVNAGTPRKLSVELLKHFALGIINVHPGLIPEFRGSSAFEWSILEGFPICNTVHLMNHAYDAGPQIYTELYNFENGVTYNQMRSYIHLKAVELSIQFFAQLIADNFVYESELDYSDEQVRAPLGSGALNQVVELIRRRKYYKPKFVTPVRIEK